MVVPTISELTCQHLRMGIPTITKLAELCLATMVRGIRQPSSPFDWLDLQLEWDYTNPEEPGKEATKE